MIMIAEEEEGAPAYLAMRRRFAEDDLPRLVRVNPCDAARGMFPILR